MLLTYPLYHSSPYVHTNRNRDSKTAPKYKVFEAAPGMSGHQRTATLRATIEEPSPPRRVCISTTSGPMDRDVEEAVVVKTREEEHKERLENIVEAMPKVCICVYVCMCMCVCMYVCMYVCVHVYMCTCVFVFS